MAGYQVEFVDAKALVPYSRNSRTHSADQIQRIKGLILEFGWTNPILADDVIRAGHGRQLAALELYDEGHTLKLPNGDPIPAGKVPVIWCHGWSEAQKRAYVIADNQSAIEGAGWNFELLRVELADLNSDGFDMSLLCFDDKMLAGLLTPKSDGFTDPDENAPEPPAVPVTVAGDIWLLGGHRIICGDSTNPLAVDALLGKVTPQLMVTDPPYGVNYDPTARRSLQSAGSEAATGTVTNDNRDDWRDAFTLFNGPVAYIWHGEKQLVRVHSDLVACGFEPRNLIVWAKDKFVVGRGNYHSQHETCWYAVRKGKTAGFTDSRRESTLWQIEHRKNDTGHSTQKPVEAMARPIRNNSSEGQVVYDPFIGSGTTIIACEMNARVCYGIEISPAYVDVAITRWAEFTGKTPILEATGQTYAQVMAERCPDKVPKVTVKKAPRKKGEA